MNVELIKGDCLEVLKDISDNSVDCFITDLPYGSTTAKWDKRIDLHELWKQMKRIARNERVPYFFFCDMKFAVELINSNKSWYRFDFVIEKTRKVGFLNARKMPLRSHELLLLFYQSPPKYYYYKYHSPTTIKSAVNLSSEGVYATRPELIHSRVKTSYTPTLPCSILKMKQNNKPLHHTQKGTELIEFILKYYTEDGDTILDPTMGSGSTGEACVSLNRKFIGIELNEKFYNVAQNRINNLIQ